MKKIAVSDDVIRILDDKGITKQVLSIECVSNATVNFVNDKIEVQLTYNTRTIKVEYDLEDELSAKYDCEEVNSRITRTK